MTVVTTPITDSQIKPDSTADRKMKNFPAKPAVPGMPARQGDTWPKVNSGANVGAAVSIVITLTVAGLVPHTLVAVVFMVSIPGVAHVAVVLVPVALFKVPCPDEIDQAYEVAPVATAT